MKNKSKTITIKHLTTISNADLSIPSQDLLVIHVNEAESHYLSINLISAYCNALPSTDPHYNNTLKYIQIDTSKANAIQDTAELLEYNQGFIEILNNMANITLKAELINLLNKAFKDLDKLAEKLAK